MEIHRAASVRVLRAGSASLRPDCDRRRAGCHPVRHAGPDLWGCVHDGGEQGGGARQHHARQPDGRTTRSDLIATDAERAVIPFATPDPTFGAVSTTAASKGVALANTMRDNLMGVLLGPI